MALVDLDYSFYIRFGHGEIDATDLQMVVAHTFSKVAFDPPAIVKIHDVLMNLGANVITTRFRGF
jgi:hypothetical protein